MKSIKILFFICVLILNRNGNCSTHDKEDDDLKQNMTSFLQIPIEIHTHISSFLNQKDFINFSNISCACKAAAQIVKDQKELNLSGKKLNQIDCEIIGRLPFAKIILVNCELGTQEIQVISQYQDIKELDLSHNYIPAEGVKALATGNLSSVTTLRLVKSLIRAQEITLLGTGNLSSLTTLYLNLNHIRIEGARALAACNLPSLSTLYLAKNAIEDEGAKALATGNLSSLTKLYLTDNYITDEGAKALATGNLSSLTTLYLADNNIKAEGAKALATGNLSSLTTLYLSKKPIRAYFNILKSLNSKISIIGVEGAGILSD